MTTFHRPMLFLAASLAVILACGLPSQDAFAEAADDDEIIEEVVVTGIRGSLRQSIDRKRMADGVMDALVAEDIGKFPDQNIAESLQRVPGVAIDRQLGEGTNISLRGLGPEFVRVEVNGRSSISAPNRIWDGSGHRNMTRRFNFQSLQAELVQAVEVYKTAQANQLEGGVGGTVNIQTRRPFDNGGRRILAGNVFATDDNLADDNGYRAAGVFSDTFGDGNFGVLFSVAADDRVVRTDYFVVPDYDLKFFNNPVDESGNPMQPCPVRDAGGRGCGVTTGNITPGIQIGDVERLNVSSALQWRPNDRTEVVLDLLHSGMERDVVDYRIPYRPQAALAARATDVHTTSMDQGQVTTYYRTTGARPRPRPAAYIVDTDQNQIALNVAFAATDKWDLNFDVSHATGDLDLNNQNVYYDIVGGIPLIFDATRSGIPDVIIEGEEALLDPAMMSFGRYIESDQYSRDEETQFRADATYSFDDDTRFIAGVSYRDRQRSWQRTSFAIGARWGDFVGETLADGWVEFSSLPVDDAFDGLPMNIPTDWLSADPRSVKQAYVIERGDEIPQQRYDDATSHSSEDFMIEETQTAVYLMLEMAGDIGDIPWSGNVGVRWVQVDRESSGLVQGIARVYYSEQAQLIEMDLLPAAFEAHPNDFAEVLPSLNLRFELSDDLVGRFGWGKAMVQPNFTDLNPGGIKHDSTRRIVEGNPNLDPYVAQQLDIGLEWYPTEDAIVALNLFAKEIDSFVINDTILREYIDPNTGVGVPDPEYGGTVHFFHQGPINGDGAFVGGLEFAVQYAFTNLPEPFDGLGVMFNHTWVDTDAEFVNRAWGATFDVPGLSPNTTNAVIFYEKYGFSGRVAWNRREEFLFQIASARGNPEFTKDYWQLDVGLGYEINDRISLLLEAINLTDEIQHRYVIASASSPIDSMVNLAHTGRRIQGGVRLRF